MGTVKTPAAMVPAEIPTAMAEKVGTAAVEEMMAAAAVGRSPYPFRRQPGPDSSD
jgi:hypothetical protein